MIGQATVSLIKRNSTVLVAETGVIPHSSYIPIKAWLEALLHVIVACLWDPGDGATTIGSIVSWQEGRNVLEDLPQPWLWPGRVRTSHTLQSTTGLRKSVLPCVPSDESQTGFTSTTVALGQWRGCLRGLH